LALLGGIRARLEINWHKPCTTLLAGIAEQSIEGGTQHMKELASGFAQLTAIVILLISLAVSTAAFSQWVSP
jgi:hypothetical protein